MAKQNKLWLGSIPSLEDEVTPEETPEVVPAEEIPADDNDVVPADVPADGEEPIEEPSNDEIEAMIARMEDDDSEEEYSDDESDDDKEEDDEDTDEDDSDDDDEDTDDEDVDDSEVEAMFREFAESDGDFLPNEGTGADEGEDGDELDPPAEGAPEPTAEDDNGDEEEYDEESDDEDTDEKDGDDKSDDDDEEKDDDKDEEEDTEKMSKKRSIWDLWGRMR